MNLHTVKFLDNLLTAKASRSSGGKACTSGPRFYNGNKDNAVYQLSSMLSDLIATIFNIQLFLLIK